ncbi:MAG TPA: GWxTD domain-containing protein [Gemmatimonadales bacterium]|jgi:GWxTD domain-containing protein|nr:GWxTD domain-containing protein [Gemmatimonadales bacterium]
MDRLMSGRVLAQVALVVAFAAAPFVPAYAQSSQQRAALQQFQDSLTSVSDTTSLLRLERSLIESAKVYRDSTVLHLRLGFIALRLGELGGQSHFEDAASEFQWSIDLEPEWPYPWYGMGLAEYGIGDSHVSVVAGLQQMFGKDALSRSAIAFAKSAEVDPSFAKGLVELANTALQQRVNIKLNVALDALRRAAGTSATLHPDVLLARGRVEREVGDADSAVAAFRQYAAFGDDRALGLLEIARTRLMLGDLAGQLAYYEGARADDSVAVAGYRRDLALIAPDSVLDKFDAARGAARAALLQHFWTSRDERSLRTPGARLAEHYRRYFYARRNFFLASTKRHYDIVERYRSGSKEFDDRGVIYIRHGAPTARAFYNAPGVEPNESWRYSRPEGDLLFHFIAREDVQDYKLVESLFDVLGFSNAVLLGARSSQVGSEADELLTSRQKLSPLYSRLQGVGEASGERYRAEERRLGRESIHIGTTTDSYTLHFARDLDAEVHVLAVGHDKAGPLVQITYGIRGESLQPVRIARGYLYSVRLRFAAMDSSGAVVASLDTTRQFVSPSAVPPREHLLGRVDMHVPPGDLSYRVAVEQGADAGRVTPLDTIRVAAVAATRPRLSDLALGSGMAHLAWTSDVTGDSVLFNPLGLYSRNDTLQVYYEVFGITAGAGYTTQIEVRKGKGGGGVLRKVFGGGGTAIKLRFQDRAGPAGGGLHRDVSLEKLSPGTYTLRVTVTDAAGNDDRREERFTVVGR